MMCIIILLECADETVKMMKMRGNRLASDDGMERFTKLEYYFFLDICASEILKGWRGTIWSISSNLKTNWAVASCLVTLILNFVDSSCNFHT